jgi:hypothetical protein
MLDEVITALVAPTRLASRNSDLHRYRKLPQHPLAFSATGYNLRHFSCPHQHNLAPLAL